VTEQLDHLVASLSSRFGDEIFSASALVHGGREVVARQLERLRGYRFSTIVEIGTRHGVMAAALARVAGSVFTIDLHESPLVREVLACAGARNVVPLRVASDEAKGLLLNSLRFDAAFIDGSHERDDVAFDFEHTRRCGRLLFHDYADPGFHGVTEFVDSIAHGTVVRDIPFAWWFAPDIVPFERHHLWAAVSGPRSLRPRAWGGAAMPHVRSAGLSPYLPDTA